MDTRENNPEEAPLVINSLSSTATLQATASQYINKNGGDTDIGHNELVRTEVKWLSLSSIPLVLAYFCQTSFTFISVLSVGHLGVNELAASSLANMIINLVVCMPCVGLASALETFCSTAYTASNDKTRVGFHMQRGIITVTIQLIPTVFLFFFIDPLLTLIGQTPEVSELCGKFLRMWLLGSWPLVAFECLKRFVQAQGIMQAGTWIMAFVAPLHWYNSYALVWSKSFGIGFLGAPLATVISHWLLFLGLVGYIAFSRAREAWGGIDLSCIRGIWEFYRLAIPGAAMLACSWTAFELVTLGSSMFGPVTLAAQACIFNVMALTYQIPAAIGAAAATRIGNSLGNCEPRRARYASILSIVLGYTVGLVCSLLLFHYRKTWGYIFTSDEGVVELCSRLMPFFAAVQTFDGMNGLLGGILRAIGQQRLGAYFAFPSFWIVAIPLAFYLGMGPPRLEIIGLWVGLSVGVILYSLIQQFFIVFRVDWKHEVMVCYKRLGWSAPSDSHDEYSDASLEYGTM